jgi:hypothetical protein
MLFCLAICFRISYTQMFEGYSNEYMPLLANKLTKMFSINPNIFFRKEVNVEKWAGA